jgi:hypothetical protein
MKFFTMNVNTGSFELNDHDILLTSEFSKLWAQDRNKCPDDPTGIARLRAFREFKYIYLMLDWTSPYSKYDEPTRHQECLKDADITEEEWSDPDFRAACRKYRDIQDSSKVLKLIKAAQGVVEKITDYFEDIDLSERDPVTQKPIYKTKDVMNELQNISSVVSELQELEELYKKEQQAESKVRGDATPGFMDRG